VFGSVAIAVSAEPYFFVLVVPGPGPGSDLSSAAGAIWWEKYKGPAMRAMAGEVLANLEQLAEAAQQ